MSEASRPAIPWVGLLEMLRGWSGKGQLYTALAMAAGQDGGDLWTARDVERRARRVLFAQLEPALAKWPTSTAAWRDALPAQSRRTKVLSLSPAGSVDWVATRLRGWPPDSFDVRVRDRSPDQQLVTLLKWTLLRLQAVRRDAAFVLPGLDAAVSRQLDAALAMLEVPPVSAADPQHPTAGELRAARSAGRPWGVLADVARLLLAEDSDLDDLARRMLLPHDNLAWRLFHLGCLGVVIGSLRTAGCRVDSLRPLSGAGGGPAFRVHDTMGRQWDLWFEAGGMWSHYQVESPYRVARQALPGVAQPIGADIALVHPTHHALLVECKYSLSADYIGRQGYLQALAYLTEARSGLVEAATAAVVGPEGAIGATGWTSTIAGDLAFTDPIGLATIVAEAVS